MSTAGSNNKRKGSGSNDEHVGAKLHQLFPRLYTLLADDSELTTQTRYVCVATAEGGALATIEATGEMYEVGDELPVNWMSTHMLVAIANLIREGVVRPQARANAQKQYSNSLAKTRQILKQSRDLLYQFILGLLPRGYTPSKSVKIGAKDREQLLPHAISMQILHEHNNECQTIQAPLTWLIVGNNSIPGAVMKLLQQLNLVRSKGWYEAEQGREAPESMITDPPTDTLAILDEAPSRLQLQEGGNRRYVVLMRLLDNFVFNKTKGFFMTTTQLDRVFPVTYLTRLGVLCLSSDKNVPEAIEFNDADCTILARSQANVADVLLNILHTAGTASVAAAHQQSHAEKRMRLFCTAMVIPNHPVLLFEKQRKCILSTEPKTLFSVSPDLVPRASFNDIDIANEVTCFALMDGLLKLHAAKIASVRSDMSTQAGEPTKEQLFLIDSSRAVIAGDGGPVWYWVRQLILDKKYDQAMVLLGKWHLRKELGNKTLSLFGPTILDGIILKEKNTAGGWRSQAQLDWLKGSPTNPRQMWDELETVEIEFYLGWMYECVSYRHAEGMSTNITVNDVFQYRIERAKEQPYAEHVLLFEHCLSLIRLLDECSIPTEMWMPWDNISMPKFLCALRGSAPLFAITNGEHYGPMTIFLLWQHDCCSAQEKALMSMMLGAPTTYTDRHIACDDLVEQCQHGFRTGDEGKKYHKKLAAKMEKEWKLVPHNAMANAEADIDCRGEQQKPKRVHDSGDACGYPLYWFLQTKIGAIGQDICDSGGNPVASGVTPTGEALTVHARHAVQIGRERVAEYRSKFGFDTTEPQTNDEGNLSVGRSFARLPLVEQGLEDEGRREWQCKFAATEKLLEDSNMTGPAMTSALKLLRGHVPCLPTDRALSSTVSKFSLVSTIDPAANGMYEITDTVSDHAQYLQENGAHSVEFNGTGWEILSFNGVVVGSHIGITIPNAGNSWSESPSITLSHRQTKGMVVTEKRRLLAQARREAYKNGYISAPNSTDYIEEFRSTNAGDLDVESSDIADGENFMHIVLSEDDAMLLTAYDVKPQPCDVEMETFEEGIEDIEEKKGDDGFDDDWEEP
jgi:hypothetical protein